MLAGSVSLIARGSMTNWSRGQPPSTFVASISQVRDGTSSFTEAFATSSESCRLS